MSRSLMSIGLLGLVLALCLALPALADPPSSPPPAGVQVETGKEDAPIQPDSRYAHGCTVVCNWPKGPCGWASAKSNSHSTSQLCNTAERYASDVCRREGKTPITNCYIHNSW